MRRDPVVVLTGLVILAAALVRAFVTQLVFTSSVLFDVITVAFKIAPRRCAFRIAIGYRRTYISAGMTMIDVIIEIITRATAILIIEITFIRAVR